MKTSELTRHALNWAVAKCEGAGTPYIGKDGKHHLATANYSTDWSRAGPIIERESIGFTQGNEVCDDWVASYSWVRPRMDIDDSVEGIGDTPLIAAMRCYVASKLDNEVNVPEELEDEPETESGEDLAQFYGPSTRI